MARFLMARFFMAKFLMASFFMAEAPGAQTATLAIRRTAIYLNTHH